MPMPSEPLPIYTRYFPAETDDGVDHDKQERILEAAQRLFVRYGVKRTSFDDIVQEAGIAKGTLYLYYDSKNVLFAAVAARLCTKLLDQAHQAVNASASLTEQLVGVLDAYVGVIHRLVAESPHMAELIDGKESIASDSFDTFDRDMKAMLHRILNDAGISRDDAVEMFVAAALGTLGTGDIAEQPYPSRLTRLLNILVIGLTDHPDRQP